MMYILSVAIQKGGVAKTTTAWAVSGELRKRGYRVLTVDLDSQSSLTMISGGKVSNTSSYEVIVGQSTAAESVQKTPQGDLISGSPKLALLPAEVSKGDELRLRDALRTLEARYDYVIIDCPPGAGPLIVSALLASDGVILPAETDGMSMRALVQISRLIKSAQQRNQALKVLGVVPTRWTGRTLLSRMVSPELDNLASEMNTKVLQPIRPAVAVMEAQIQVEALHEYAPKCNAAKDYAVLTDQILEQIEGKKNRRK